VNAPARNPDVRHRSWLEIRWRQFRNAPRPVVRAVGSSLTVAVALGLAYLAFDVVLTRTGGDADGRQRFVAGVAYVAAVLASGALITWLIVPLPRGSGERVTRTPWSAALGLFAAVPIAYLVLVVVVQVLKPLLT
jgi:hypothetical protein